MDSGVKDCVRLLRNAVWKVSACLRANRAALPCLENVCDPTAVSAPMRLHTALWQRVD